MRRNKLIALLLILPLFFTAAVSARAESYQTYTVAQVQSLCDGIVAYNGYSSNQSFADGYLPDNAGVTAEFYAVALSQSGSCDLSRYENALLSYLDTHEVYAASTREKFALALSASGSTDRYIADTADEAIGGQGIMSLVFGLHLLNNGYDSALYSTDGLVSEILSWQKDDGGWAVMGAYGDADVTAMTLQALAPHTGRSDIAYAVDRALDRLSDMQLESGGFKTMGAENSESAAQVVIALSSLGIDAQTDGRFVKSGGSVMNALTSYRCSDGSFAHTDSSNVNATLEAFCAFTAYKRYCYGQSPLYVLDHANHSAPADNTPRQGGSSSSQSRGNNNTDTNNNAHSDNRGTNADDQTAGGSDTAPQTDENGNRIIVINGQRFIEATTATGEKMTVSVEETQPSEQSTVSAAKPTYGGFQPSATADYVRATADQTGGKGSYKPYAILAVILAAGAVCAVLFFMKKRNKKHYIAVGIIAVAGILFILLTDFQSKDSFDQPAKTDGGMTVTLSIRCDTIKDREKVNRLIPDDGIILDTTTFTAAEGDTVYDVLMQAIRAEHIPLDNRGAKGAAYIAGINALYEFDYGELSGWMYRVNGEFPDVGCESYHVSDGDKIEWLYTTDIGKDLSDS
ncbi:MAG: DUF4430 domain-containing protein [Ruminococcus sp.]|nr:DUF4430 domain-containing protein [Ruminococcus sp.]